MVSFTYLSLGLAAFANAVPTNHKGEEAAYGMDGYNGGGYKGSDYKPDMKGGDEYKNQGQGYNYGADGEYGYGNKDNGNKGDGYKEGKGKGGMGPMAGGMVHTILAIARPVEGTNKTNFVFEPNEIMASKGDIVEFQFGTVNHSVAMGDFMGSPCAPPASGGFFSGYQPAPPGGLAPNAFRVMVETEDPMVFYCTQGKHCLNGMYGVINGNEHMNRMSYGAAITDFSAQGGTVVTPPMIGGGELVPLNNDGMVSSMPPMPPMPPSTETVPPPPAATPPPPPAASTGSATPPPPPPPAAPSASAPTVASPPSPAASGAAAGTGLVGISPSSSGPTGVATVAAGSGFKASMVGVAGALALGFAVLLA